MAGSIPLSRFWHRSNPCHKQLRRQVVCVMSPTKPHVTKMGSDGQKSCLTSFHHTNLVNVFSTQSKCHQVGVYVVNVQINNRGRRSRTYTISYSDGKKSVEPVVWTRKNILLDRMKTRSRTNNIVFLYAGHTHLSIQSYNTNYAPLNRKMQRPAYNNQNPTHPAPKQQVTGAQEILQYEWVPPSLRMRMRKYDSA